MTVSLDNTLWLASSVAEAAVIALLLYRRVWKTLPVFCLYSAWTLFSAGVNYGVHSFLPSHYLTTYLAGMVLDSVLQFAVIVELAWSVLRPSRASLPRRVLFIVAGSVIALGAAIWPFAAVTGFAYRLPSEMLVLMQLQQTVSILRILFFLVLAGCSHLLSIGWRDRELQVATGLGFYSFASLAVVVLHTHQSMNSQFARLNQVAVASYICSLAYWVYSFATKEAERREFTPQMQSFLLAVAGTARSSRIALAESPSALDIKNRKR
jgi:hypothetical protein